MKCSLFLDTTENLYSWSENNTFLIELCKIDFISEQIFFLTPLLMGGGRIIHFLKLNENAYLLCRNVQVLNVL